MTGSQSSHAESEPLLADTDPASTKSPPITTSYSAISDNDNASNADDSRDAELDDDDELEDGNYLKSEFQGLSWRQRPSVPILLAMVLINMAGAMASMTSMIDVLLQIICQDHYKTAALTGGGGSGLLPPPVPLDPADPRCKSPDVAAQVGYFMTAMTTTASLLTLLTIAQLGSLSDKWGRKPVLVINTACTIVERLFVMACCLKPELVNYRWILVGVAIGGAGGTTGLQMILCASYITDCIKEIYRAKVMSYVDGCFFAGIAFGPIVGSLILSCSGRNVILLLFFSLATDVLFLLGVLVVLPESRSERSRRKSIVDANALRELRAQQRRRESADNESVFESVPLLSRKGVLRLVRTVVHMTNLVEPLAFLKFAHIRAPAQRRNVYSLIVASALMTDLIGSLMSFIIILTKIKFNFTAVENNYFLFISGSGKFLVLTFLLPFLLKLGKKFYPHSPFQVDSVDKRVLQFGFTCSALSLLLNAESPTPLVFFISVATLTLGGVVNPILRNAIIKHAPRNQVGEVLGAVGLVVNLFGIVAPMISAAIFNYTTRFRMQFVLEFAAMIELALLVFMSFLAVPASPSIEQVDSFVESS